MSMIFLVNNYMGHKNASNCHSKVNSMFVPPLVLNFDSLCMAVLVFAYASKNRY